MSFKYLHRIKIINLFLIVALFLIQINVQFQANCVSNNSVPESIISNSNNNSDFIIPVSPIQNVVKNSDQVKISYIFVGNNSYTKNEIRRVTDSKRIYNGNFSSNFRYKTFLTVFFSTNS